MTGWDAAGATPAKDASEGCGPDCEQALGRLFAYVDHELEPVDADRVRAHIEDCRPCLDEMAVDTMLKELVKRSCHEQAPEELRVKIHARLTTLKVTRTTTL
ncbi:mycothiol system anti-sigma-R factor [Cellulomonas endometrii]|uniref:mycothiol system anti-sigma-R factor n=1 Tax=Cellulomonas endometrii TaxID=3036301 RepID=UPI0024AD3113|nr:mycothiol system anti-sigma-R factor [Cellulomonas endometrii]